MKTEIYVIAHRAFTPPAAAKGPYTPLYVGAAAGNIVPPGSARDDEGQNISARNPWYCELTGLYWIWKHGTADVEGLCHYRRYFVTPRGKLENLLWGRQSGFLTEAQITELLRGADMIRHNPTFFGAGVAAHYAQHHDPATLQKVEQILAARHPADLAAYRQVMQGKKAHLLNMMITTRPLLNEYAEWLFDILFCLEEQVGLGPDTKRLMGYLAERLLDVWILSRGLRAADCFSINTERVDRLPF